MSVNRNNRRKKKKLQTKQLKSKERMTLTLVFTIAFLSLLGFGITFYSTTPHANDGQRIEQSEGPVPSNLVCMVFDSYKGVEQIPIEVNNVIYYGCCQGCIDKLKNNLNNVCFAEDPLSKKQVDKGVAFIALKPKR